MMYKSVDNDAPHIKLLTVSPSFPSPWSLRITATRNDLPFLLAFSRYGGGFPPETVLSCPLGSLLFCEHTSAYAFWITEIGVDAAANVKYIEFLPFSKSQKFVFCHFQISPTIILKSITKS